MKKTEKEYNEIGLAILQSLVRALDKRNCFHYFYNKQIQTLSLFFTFGDFVNRINIDCTTEDLPIILFEILKLNEDEYGIS